MLTARAETEDRIKGLEAGVDDYLPRPMICANWPFAWPPCCAGRRRARARRASLKPASFGDFIFDPDRGELRQGEDVIRITERERDMLRILVENPGDTVSREALGGAGGAANERTVDVQVNRLRRKIEVDPANPLHLQTVRGLGYKLAIDR